MKMRHIAVDASVLLTPSFKNSRDFSGLVGDFLLQFSKFPPTHWGVIEPINLKLNAAELRDFLQESNSSDISWKRKTTPKGWGVFKKRTYLTRGAQFARHRLEFAFDREEQIADLVEYLHHLVAAFGVEYAFCDSMTPNYKSIGLANGFAPSAGNLMIFTHQLVKVLPDILWAQVFGPAYVKLFGLDNLLSAPAYKVQQLDSETVYLQLSESLFDLHNNYDTVDAIRQQVKQHLDDNIIFDSHNAVNHVYRVPHFEFSE